MIKKIDVTQKYIDSTNTGGYHCNYCKTQTIARIVKLVIRQEGWRVVHDESDRHEGPPHDYWMCPNCWIDEMAPLFREIV